ncbi:hypothetical protein [Arthrobacter sp. TWP1-1]|uniref:hypothetical protein n=1 Tax=Arthrobacter sp. TWP1-1 TaxID=2804568 RepID=UPI003CECED78
MIASYVFNGELFSASSNELYVQSKYAHDLAHGIVDMQSSQLWDACAIAAQGTLTHERLGGKL